MNPQQRTEVARYLAAFDFSGLFTDPSIGWDWPDSGKPLRVPLQNGFVELSPIAAKKGVRILQVPPQENGKIMPSDLRKKLEKAVTPLAAEHLLIFVDEAKTRQIWLWTSRLPGKPVRHRELNWEKGRSNELLLQKLTTITFTLDEEDALDVTGVVQRLRDSLDRDTLTKKFYNEFKSQKDRFQDFITGLSDEGILAHYTSLMLNRLMFCYFLQQKGFLNGEQNYLGARLRTVQDTLGQNQFHSFYRTFLKRLFFEGLDGEARPPELTALIGSNIPYLNGGIFAEHPIERAHPDIRIPDKAFEKIFRFFDEWNWHLDDRPLGKGNEINPEVLGYVFEKYTNQKEMGAYYTKEDITEYISKNTVLPYLLQAVADKLPTNAWSLLKEDPNRYIYEPVRRGAGDTEEDWKKSLPENIAVGIDLEKPKLLDRRRHWNEPTSEPHKLPTEIWRETIVRHQRAHELRRKLGAGEVRDSADLVTLNLDIRQFVQDIIAAAPADLALALWKALRNLSVLDPTCGSGAFLFAALEILQPLYEGLLERLRALLADWKTTGEKHPNWEREIGKIVEAVEHHPNEGYFIHKTIIIHNLYGVDIMEEAVEICKLRLFLKLAAQLEPGQAIEPLPDIDFNIRAGNTLVGYASREEIKRAFTEAAGSGQTLLQGIENSLDDYNRIMEQAEHADRAFRRFQDLQDIGQSASDFRPAKEQLENILQSLRSQLDRFLAAQYHQQNLKNENSLLKWRNSHEPFHWFVEFFGILNSGGFNVVIGNPPYVEYNKIIGKYRIHPGTYITEACGNLLAIVTERSMSLLSDQGRSGLVLLVSTFTTERMRPLQEKILSKYKSIWISNFAWRPSKLFDGCNTINSIFIGAKESDKDQVGTTYSTRYLKWNSEEREHLFPSMFYGKTTGYLISGSLPKVSSVLEAHVLDKILADSVSLEKYFRGSNSKNRIYYFRGMLYWIKALDTLPLHTEDGKPVISSQCKEVHISSEMPAATAISIISSSLFFWFYQTFSDCQQINRREFRHFRAGIEMKLMTQLSEIGSELLSDYKSNSRVIERNIRGRGVVVMKETFRINRSKHILDKIDALLAKHYGLTDEELDFIINYDIKYRMGLGDRKAESEADGEA